MSSFTSLPFHVCFLQPEILFPALSFWEAPSHPSKPHSNDICLVKSSLTPPENPQKELIILHQGSHRSWHKTYHSVQYLFVFMSASPPGRRIPKRRVWLFIFVSAALTQCLAGSRYSVSAGRTEMSSPSCNQQSVFPGDWPGSLNKRQSLPEAALGHLHQELNAENWMLTFNVCALEGTHHSKFDGGYLESILIPEDDM